MKQEIWKFEMPIEAEFVLEMPKFAEILTVQQEQKTMMPCIWVLVNPEQEKEERFFELFGTGYPIHNDIGIVRTYIGTCQYQNGQFVGHLFERID